MADDPAVDLAVDVQVVLVVVGLVVVVLVVDQLCTKQPVASVETIASFHSDQVATDQYSVATALTSKVVALVIDQVDLVETDEKDQVLTVRQAQVEVQTEK